MSEPFIGEIIAVGFYFDPSGFRPPSWMPCDGRLLPVSQYSALFSLIGTLYGGNGTTTFAVPNLNGRIALGQGSGPGLTPRSMGETLGVDTVTLQTSQIPAHTHGMQIGPNGVAGAGPKPGSPGSTVLVNPALSGYVPPPADQVMVTAIGLAGNSQPHSNDQPTQALWYCIATTGIFPSFG